MLAQRLLGYSLCGYHDIYSCMLHIYHTLTLNIPKQPFSQFTLSVGHTHLIFQTIYTKHPHLSLSIIVRTSVCLLYMFFFSVHHNLLAFTYEKCTALNSNLYLSLSICQYAMLHLYFWLREYITISKFQYQIFIFHVSNYTASFQ